MTEGKRSATNSMVEFIDVCSKMVCLECLITQVMSMLPDVIFL